MNDEEMQELLRSLHAFHDKAFKIRGELSALEGITLKEEEEEEEEMAKKVDWNERAKADLLRQAQNIGKYCPTLSDSGRNLTAMYLEGKLEPCYHREDTITAIQKILLRKSKANVLLTGPAGCGKTAIAEGLSALFAERDIVEDAEVLRIKAEYDSACRRWRKANSRAEENGELYNEPYPADPTYPKPTLLSHTFIFELSLTSLTAGTQYRGQLEEKVKKVIEECKAHPEIVLFIDEIHQIVTAGKAEGSEGTAQMLKPALARRDIRCIGATTTEEARVIWKDKALTRRFNEVKVNPLYGVPAIETADKILADYCQYHAVTAPTILPSALLEKISFFLPETVFPDNFINIVDETLAGARFDGLTEVDMSHFNATLSRITGVVIVDE